MSVQQNIANFRQAVRDRVGALEGNIPPPEANGEIVLTGSTTTDMDILLGVVESFSSSPAFTGTASFANVIISGSLQANNTYGNVNQILRSNGSSIYWDNELPAAFSNGQSISVSTVSSGNTTITGFANISSSLNVSTTLAAGNTTITGFANVSSSLNVATTLAAGNTTITGFANVSGSIQGGSSLTVAGALSGVTTAAVGNTTITGFANVSSTIQGSSLGVGTAASGTSGEIRATNNITAYYSDGRLKTKVGDITDPLLKVRQIKTLLYHANEIAVALGYDPNIIEVGVDAQSVQLVQPEAVAPAPIDSNYLTVRYERLIPILIESVKALEDRIIAIELGK